MAKATSKVVESVETVSTPAEPIVVEEKYTKVTPKFSGMRKIAGKWYEFTVDKEIEVTQEAKRVLKEAKAIYI